MNSPAPLDVKSASERVLGWQTRLHRWAVQDEQARFGDLFNLVCDPATLLVAWERVKRNRGSRTAGVDGQTRKRVEQMGVDGVLAELRQELKAWHLSSAARPRAADPEALGEAQKLGHLRAARQDRADRGQARARADLRGGLLPDLVWIQARASSPGRDRRGAVLHQPPTFV